jgi:hypothetical protein
VLLGSAWQLPLPPLLLPLLRLWLLRRARRADTHGVPLLLARRGAPLVQPPRLPLLRLLVSVAATGVLHTLLQLLDCSTNAGTAHALLGPTCTTSRCAQLACVVAV